jgi:hypothetical protein
MRAAVLIRQRLEGRLVPAHREAAGGGNFVEIEGQNLLLQRLRPTNMSSSPTVSWPGFISLTMRCGLISLTESSAGAPAPHAHVSQGLTCVTY